ncbi:MAG TPA: IS481 family transposase [Burkholderiales bacterium]|nr:IS481 family transposase [Burkholderiales bacterium]
MNIHKNARLTLKRRIELVRIIIDQGLSRAQAAGRTGVSEPTARKWWARYLAQGEAGLHDRSSRPNKSPRTIAPQKALAIIELRRRRLTQARIAASLGLSPSTVGRVLRRAGLSRLRELEPAEPVVRYEHEHPGDLIHIDTKKLGRIERMSHRVTGNRRDTVNGAGWEFLFVAVDDHSRIGFTDLYPDECKASAIQFLHNTVAYFRSLGVHPRGILTDNGSAFRSKAFAAACQRLGLRHRFTRAYRPQTNGKAERFIQSALREWAYGIPYHHSSEREHMLERWRHHYNWHRPHQGIKGMTPISRLAQPRNNLLTLHS